MSTERRPIVKKISQLLIYAVPAVIALVLVFSLIRLFTRPSRGEIIATATIGKVDVNREFFFPLQDNTGAITSSSLKYTVISAELTPKIVIQGKQASAIKGRIFLILNLKIENPTNNALKIKTRDFVRLMPEGTQDRLAPDTHNDPTDLQPIATKFTRVGFVIDDSVKNFKLYVGEINGEKQEIDLNF